MCEIIEAERKRATRTASCSRSAFPQSSTAPVSLRKRRTRSCYKSSSSIPACRRWDFEDVVERPGRELCCNEPFTWHGKGLGQLLRSLERRHAFVRNVKNRPPRLRASPELWRPSLMTLLSPTAAAGRCRVGCF